MVNLSVDEVDGEFFAMFPVDEDVECEGASIGRWRRHEVVALDRFRLA